MPYLPLDPAREEIRVLSIVASDDSSKPVECSLEQVSLQDKTPMYSDYVSENIPSGLKLLDGWIKFSHKNQAGFESSHSSIFNIPYWRWKFCGQFDERFRPVIPYETQDDIKRPDVQIFPRYTWGDFEALSYCWESENLEKEIILDGNITKVPKNLEAALRALGKLPETRMGMKFWIDYLCINQKDTTEKNHQVNFMGIIYSSALSVVAWLGPEEDESDKVIQLIASMNNLKGETQLLERFPPSLWKSLYTFLCRNYWQRLWIIQELALNNNMTLFLCGNDVLSRSLIEFASEFYMRYIDQFEIAIRPQVSLDVGGCEKWSEYENGRSRAYHAMELVRMHTQTRASKIEKAREGMYQLLTIGRHAKAKDSRDKIYGLLGVLPRIFVDSIYPDYDLSLGEVYINFAKSILETAGKLDDVLSWSSYSPDSEMPSWVPDWRAPFNRHYLHQLKSPHIYDDRIQYQPREAIRKWRVEGHYNHLVCSSVLIDTITTTSCSPELGSAYSPKSLVMSSPTKLTKAILIKNPYGKFQDVKVALGRTLGLNLFDAFYGPTSIFDIYWIDWDVIKNAPADDSNFRLSGRGACTLQKRSSCGAVLTPSAN